MSVQLKEENHAEQQAVAQLESIVEMVAGLEPEECTNNLCNKWHGKGYRPHDCRTKEIEGWDSEDEAREDTQQTIQEDPLSLQLRSGWYTPGEEKPEAEEFEILLCTGGPAVRIVGGLDMHNQPERPRLQYQDWGTPWTEYFPTDEQREALQTYCEQFYYGE